MGDQLPYCSRNLFSCINLLRLLNKLTKWKHSRIMMLVVFKSAPILKRALKVKHAMMQLYVLKLLKMQTKYLGRQYRKSNMKIMSAIYQKVRHRLNDDWAYGNGKFLYFFTFLKTLSFINIILFHFNMHIFNFMVRFLSFFVYSLFLINLNFLYMFFCCYVLLICILIYLG